MLRWCPDCEAGLSIYAGLLRCNVCGLEVGPEGRVRRRVNAPTLPSEVAKSPGPTELSEPGKSPQLAQPSSHLPKQVKYRSDLRAQIRRVLLGDRSASDLEVCRGLDNEEFTPPENMQTNERSFESAYQDPKIKPRLATLISKVRHDMRKQGLM